MSTLIVAVGHSVVRVGEIFRPSGLVQEITWTPEKRILRTGVDNPALD